MEMPLIVRPITRFQIRNNNIINEKIQHSASWMVHMLYVNTNNENETLCQLCGAHAAC